MALERTLPELDRSMPILEALVRHLGLAIMGGVYKPGDVLPNEGEYSQGLDVSRNAYREAIRYLAAKGMVESRRKAGTKVLPRDRWSLLDPDVMDWAFRAAPSEELERNLMELRLIIEPAAAELAARHRTQDDLDVLAGALEALREAKQDHERGRLAGERFHRRVLTASHNELLASMASSMEVAVNWTLIYMREHRAKLPDPFEEHARLFDAIQTQDTALARDVMRSIVRLAYRGAYRQVPMPM